MSKIKYFLIQHIFPGFYATSTNKKITSEYEKQLNFKVDLSNINEISDNNIEQVKSLFTEYIEQLKLDLKEQHDRKKIIEDKAKSLLFIITVSITAITFSLNYLNSLIINAYQLFSLIILIFSISSFTLGTIRALQALNIRQFHIIQAEVQLTNDSFKLSKKKTEEDFLKELIKSKQLNDLINIRLSNYAFASFNLIRNGIVLFVIFFVTTLSVNYFLKNTNTKTKDKHIISKEIKVKINDSININVPYTFELKYDVNNLELKKEKEKTN